MSGPLSVLRELHRLRRHVRDLQEQIERAPQLLRAQQARVARAEAALHEGHEAIKKLKVKNHELEVSLKGTHQLIEKHQRQLNEATSKKEYDALQAEIKAERKKAQDFEDKILEGMSEVEDRTAKVPELDQALAKAKQDCADFERTASARVAEQRKMCDETLAKIKEVEATLAEEIRTEYLRLVGQRGDEALSPIKGRSCVACYTDITAQQYNDLLSERLVTCKSCGRIIYLPE